MANRDITLLNSLVGYVLDVKPYHTKLKQFLSELFFEDKFNVTFTESLFWNFYHQNVWTRDDIGGYRMFRICESVNADTIFRIPAAIWPRFSLNDNLPLQSPPGDDPATQDLTDANTNGIPDSEEPWLGSVSSSHFTGHDVKIFATWNSGDKHPNITLSNGNLTATASAAWQSVRATMGKSSGKWYWEITSNAAVNPQYFAGAAQLSSILANYVGGDASGWGFRALDYASGGGRYTNSVRTAYSPASDTQLGINEVIGVALDMDAGTITIYRGGVSQGVMYSGLTGTVYPACTPDGTDQLTVNFGQTPFVYAVPPGYNSGVFTGTDTSSDPYTFRVPFHQGSRVYVNGVIQTFGTDYVVDYTRGFIRFAVAPTVAQHIEVQLFKVDRLFIAYNFPFNYGVNRDYDNFGYDMLPYDSDEDEPGSTGADFFEFIIDSGQPSGHLAVTFYNSVPSKIPKADLTVLGLGPGNVNGDVWKVTAISHWRFMVQRNGTGTIWYANFKEPFDNGFVSFIIDRVWANYYLVPDSNTYDDFSLTVYQYDETDFFPDLSLVTEHGVFTDPNPPQHRPMHFIMSEQDTEGGYDFGGLSDEPFDEPAPVYQPPYPLGKVKKTDLGYYTFVLDEIPPRGTYVELRLEQNGQLNPWLNATVLDDMYLRVTWVVDTTVQLLDPYQYLGYDDHWYDYLETVIPAGTQRLIHNVILSPTETTFTETQNVNELVIYHGRGAAPIAVDVDFNGTPVPTTMIYINVNDPGYYSQPYFEGVMLLPDHVGVDEQRIVINLATPQAVTVTLTFA